MDTLKRALSPVCYALFVGAVCLVCDLINERVYAGAINSLAFNLTAFWAVFFLLPRPMYDEDTGRLRWRFAALLVFRLGKIKFAAMVLVLVAVALPPRDTVILSAISRWTAILCCSPTKWYLKRKVPRAIRNICWQIYPMEAWSPGHNILHFI